MTANWEYKWAGNTTPLLASGRISFVLFACETGGRFAPDALLHSRLPAFRYCI